MTNVIKTADNQLAMQEREQLINVLSNSLYPGASRGSIELVLGYCQAAGLDPLQKPVHIVPMYDSKAGKMRDVVMPGINLYRIQASRSGECAGVSEPEFGPDVVDAVVGGALITYPQWCRVTVKRMMPNGMIVDFTAKELWIENYAQKGGKEKSTAPNAMWTKRPYGQIAKCAEAQAFRKAFPELASAYTAEEMEGKPMMDQGLPDGPIESAEYTAFESEHLQAMRESALDGMPALTASFQQLPSGPLKTQFWTKHGPALKQAAEQAIVIQGEDHAAAQ
jgi:phage recombination protein Bet